VFHINVESDDVAIAEKLAHEYELKIKKWIDSEH
jgi:hypothetical protein